MPDLPEEAVREAAAAYSCAYTSGVPHDELARVILEAAAPILEAHVRADERRKVAEEFRALASRCRAIPDKGLNLGQIWQRDEQARDYDRIADMIEKRVDVKGMDRG
jgi:hypothetical protein